MGEGRKGQLFERSSLGYLGAWLFTKQHSTLHVYCESI
jgi:hypothetical protein